MATASESSASRIRLRPAVASDSRLVWAWRNDADTRHASFRTEPIAFEQHEQWFQSHLIDPDTHFFIGMDPAGQPIGSVRFDRSGDAAIVSVAIAPDRRGQGLGPALISAACRSLFDETDVLRIIASVRKDNRASLSAFRRACFGHEREVILEGIDAVQLTLNRHAA